MACASCGKQETPMEQRSNPYNAGDIYVVQQDNEIRRLTEGDWSQDRHKLLIFIPEAFTPVCETELGALNKWIPEFNKLNTDVIAVCTDTAPKLQDWFASEPQLQKRDYNVFSSYKLPLNLNLIENGRAKRSSVFIMNTGEVVKQEHFHKVGRSLAELHRMLYGFSTDSYCAEGWQSPEDGFLTPPN